MWPDGLGVPNDHNQCHQLISRALHGSGDAIRSIVGDYENDDQSLRRAFIASAIWHEKRHFFDLCLSNYGSYLSREFFNFARNFDLILADAFTMGRKLLAPITVYNDDAERLIYGIGDVPDNLLSLAAHFWARIEERDDFSEVIPAGGRLQTGGRAQLESLAFISQMMCVNQRFSPNCELLLRKRYYNDPEQVRQYTWHELVTYNVFPSLRKIVENVMFNNCSLVFCLSLAAINGSYRLPSDADIDKGSRLPFERFNNLLLDIPHNQVSYEMSFSEAWALVDKTVKKKWGRGIIEEIEIDIEHATADLSKSGEWGFCPPEIIAVQNELHRLRMKIFQTVAKNPEDHFNPNYFSERWLDRLSPIAISADPKGFPAGASSESGRGLFVKQHPSTKNTWIWGWMPNSWNCVSNNSEQHRTSKPGTNLIANIANWLKLPFAHTAQTGADVFTLSDRNWDRVITLYVPLFKILLDGRLSDNRILEQELFGAEHYISESGIELEYVPMFRYPNEKQRTSDPEELTGRSEVVCDISDKQVNSIKAIVVWPWTFRQNKRLIEALQSRHGDRVDVMLMLDWSPWIIARDLYDEH
jgi:hypothetical protein